MNGFHRQKGHITPSACWGDKVSFKVKVKIKMKPRVNIQDFLMTELLHNNTWIVILCIKSPADI